MIMPCYFHKTFWLYNFLKSYFEEFLGSPLVRTLCFHCQGPRFDPWWGTKIPRAVQSGKKKKIKGNKKLLGLALRYASC